MIWFITTILYFENIIHYDLSFMFAFLHVLMNVVTTIVFMFIDKYVINILDKYIY